ncbi:MAG: type II secretion system protein M [Desulfurivibrio sp.]|nr:type II secretion system protein M [Desulfurivibrio sp.]
MMANGDWRQQLTKHGREPLAGIPPGQRPPLSIGLGVLALLLSWLLVLAPLATERAELQARIDRQQQDLTWMRQAAARVRGHGLDAAATEATGSPLAAIDSSARELGLDGALQRVEPAGAGEVRVWLAEAPFDELVRWLARLEADHGIVAAEVNVDPGPPGSGLVDSRLSLVRE